MRRAGQDFPARLAVCTYYPLFHPLGERDDGAAEGTYKNDKVYGGLERLRGLMSL
jgi:hypothetical protein